MAKVGMSVEEQFHPRNHIKNEHGNRRDGEIWVNLNESQNNNPYEIQRTVKELRSDLKRVRDYNELILNDQEELNNSLLAKIHNDEKEKNKELEHNMPKNTSYKHKGRKMKFSNHGAKTSSEGSVKHHK